MRILRTVQTRFAKSHANEKLRWKNEPENDDLMLSYFEVMFYKFF